MQRQTVEAWWKSPVASILLVLAGLTVIGVEVWRDGRADAGGYTAGLALVGLGITGRIQSWLLNAGPEEKEKPETHVGG